MLLRRIEGDFAFPDASWNRGTALRQFPNHLRASDERNPDVALRSTWKYAQSGIHLRQRNAHDYETGHGTESLGMPCIALRE